MTELEIIMEFVKTANRNNENLATEVGKMREDFQKYHEDKVQPLHDFKNKLIGAVVMSACGGGGIAAVLTKILLT